MSEATTPASPPNWYDNPKYYDMIFALGTADELSFLQAVHARFGLSEGRRVLEPACGSGRLVEALSAAGFLVRGFDISAPMLEFARHRLQQRQLDADLVFGRMERFSVPTRCHLAHNLISTFKYLLTEEDAVSHLSHVAAALLPGGIYVLGFHLSDYDDERPQQERWAAKSGKTSVGCVIRSWPPNRKKRLERVRSRMRVREGHQSHMIETLWDFRTYSARQVRRMLAAVPEFEHVATYDFGYVIDEPRRLDDSQMDVVLILRRRPDEAR